MAFRWSRYLYVRKFLTIFKFISVADTWSTDPKPVLGSLKWTTSPNMVWTIQVFDNIDKKKSSLSVLIWMLITVPFRWGRQDWQQEKAENSATGKANHHVLQGKVQRDLLASIPNPDSDPPDPRVFWPPGSGSTSQRYGSGSGIGSGSFYHHAKIIRKILNPTILYLQKVTSRKICVKKIIFCWHLEGQWRKKQDPNPDPLVRGMDPRIRTKICHGSGTMLLVMQIRINYLLWIWYLGCSGFENCF